MSATDGTPESSLGRYLPACDGPLVQVRLLGLPVALILSSREHHDGLLRELRLLAIGDRAGAPAAAPRLVQVARSLVQRHSAARSRRDDELEAALVRGEATVDLVEHVPPAVVELVEGLTGLLEECDGFCEQGQLMTLPRPPLVRDVSRWFLAQYREQVQGRPATPWDGPLRLGPDQA